MNKIKTIISYFLLLAVIGFNLYLYFPETQILADPNDNIFQYSLVQRTNFIWQNYGCPFSINCLPNLTDHVVTTWAEGYPLPVYYSHVPQIATVIVYNLVIKPVASLFSSDYSLYQFYNLTRYLLLAFFPLPVFIALRIIGFSPLIALFGAFFSAHYSTDGLYGIDPPSFLWRGYGLTSQLYAMIFYPLALAFVYKTTLGNNLKRNIILSSLFLVLTTAGHLGMGIMALISTIPFLFLDLKKSSLKVRIRSFAVIYAVTLGILAYWIIPILLENKYHIISFWDPIWKFNSYGWYEVVRQYLGGEIFDWQRWPIITILTTIGFFILLADARYFPFALAFGMWTLVYFGRTTWGGLLDLIPGMKDFHQHRFIVAVQMASLFLVPIGLMSIISFFQLLLNSLSKHLNKLMQLFNNYTNKPETKKTTVYQPPSISISYQKIIYYLISIIFVSFTVYQTVLQTISYNKLNSIWIKQANIAYLYDLKNFNNLVSKLNSLPNGRVYAGRPGNWGKDFRLGSTQLYMLLGVNYFDISQFLPETWSPLSENEQNFDERIEDDYNLLNIRYIVAPKNQDFPKTAKLLETFGPFLLYEVPTTGWFEVVTSPMIVKTDKTNFINIVHLWQRSYARRWNMYPFISVENDPVTPHQMLKTLNMKNEITYDEETDKGLLKNKNIFADFPFVFPEATVSGTIKEEKVGKQSYSATVTVPDNCPYCMVIFKMSYHPNWEVKVDGIKSEKYSVFPFYLAAQVPPGIHTVEFIYHPGTVKTFLIYGLIATTLLVLIRYLLKYISK